MSVGRADEGERDTSCARYFQADSAVLMSF